MSWEPPREFEEYRIVRPLGAGAMGQVFLAHDTLLDRPVAIKFVALEVSASVRERFFTEARAVARLSHPNVVAIHRVGEVKHRPYLVSEYVRGTSLSAVPKPLPWERALRIGIAMARGLASAHQRGVLHRDIKPANVMIGDDDDIKLLDFGLAKLLGASLASERVEAPAMPRERDPRAIERAVEVDETVSVLGLAAVRPASNDLPGAIEGLTQQGAIVGTPLYLAPELWRGTAASRRSDLYALGSVLYELVAGRAPHAGIPLAQLATHVADQPAMPIASIVPDLPARLALVIDSCVAREPERRPESAEAVGELLEAVVARGGYVVDGSPYRGLGTFEPEHRGVFFGRSEEARAIVERLRTETLIVVAGDSGAGKSSLCRAAVLPAIAEKSLAGRRWRTATVLPGTNGLARLEAALASDQPQSAAGDGLLLFVDQLEELLTIAEPDVAARFAERLAELVVTGSHVRVVTSARSDFLGRLAALPWLGELIGRALFLLGPLSDRGLRDAIVGPARALGYELESPEMVDALVASGRRNLPLLQFTLAELWDARDERTRTIPAAALTKLGGAGGALSRRADQVMAALGDADREIAWQILIRLMTADGTRAVLARSELSDVVGDAAAAERVVERLVAARLLAVSSAADDRVEVVHEALFTGWPRLVEWRRAHEDGARMRDQHAESARRWEERGRPRGLLWRGDALADYRAWRRRWPERPTGVEAAFADASEAEVRRTRRVRFAVLGGTVVALAIGVVVLYRSDRRATAERDDAERQRRTLLVEQGAQALAAGHSARALPYLVEAMREGESGPALEVLVAEAVRPLEQELMTLRDLPAGLTGVRWTPDGKHLIAVGMDGRMIAYDRAGRIVQRAELGSDPKVLYIGASIAFSGDSRLAAFTTSVAVVVWDLATGRTIWRGGEIATTVALTPDGRHVVITTPTNKLRAWELATGTQVIDLPGLCAAISPDGRHLLVLSDTDLRRVALPSGEIEETVSVHGVLYCKVAYSPDGARAVITKYAGALSIWDASPLVEGPMLMARAVDFEISSDGRRIAALGGQDARVFEVASGALIAEIGVRSRFQGFIHFDPTATRVVIGPWGDRKQQLWNLETMRIEQTYEAPTTSPTAPHATANTIDSRFSPDGKLLVSATGNVLSVRRVESAPLVDAVPATGNWSTRLSPDGRYIATGGGRASTAFDPGTGVFEIWDRARGRRTLQQIVPSPVWEVAWNPSGSQLLAAGRNGTLGVYTGDGTLVRSFVGHDPRETINRAAWDPTGTRIATTSDDRTARIWDAATGRVLAVLPHPNRVLAPSWSADGTQLSTSGWDGVLRIWHAASGSLVAEIREPLFKFLDATISPDGAQIAGSTHSGVAAVWNIATRQRAFTLIGHTGSVTTVVWSPDGALLATSGIDATVRIWDASSGRQLVQHEVRGEALQVSWTADSKQIVVAAGGDKGGTATIWDVPRDHRSADALATLMRARVPWQLVDGRLELRDLEVESPR